MKEEIILLLTYLVLQFPVEYRGSRYGSLAETPLVLSPFQGCNEIPNCHHESILWTVLLCGLFMW